MGKLAVVLIALGRCQNFQVRSLHSMLENIEGIEPHTIFFKDYQTNRFKPPTIREEELLLDIISGVKPGLIGFSVLSLFAPIAKKLTGLLRSRSSSSIIWGGIHPTIFPDDCINDADILCIGEGEGAMKELVECLRDGKPYDSIRNLWIKNSNNVIKNTMRPFIQDLDSIAFPSYSNSSYYFIEHNKISKKDPLLKDNYIWIQASRGCPYSCTFCVNSILRPMMKDLGTYVRRRSVDSIIRQIKQTLDLPGYRGDYVMFIDESFGREGPWLEQFESRYKKEIGLPFYVEYNPNEINSKILGKLANAGLDVIDFGIQTGSDSVRNDVFRRPGKNIEILNTAREITKHSVKIRYDLILDNPYDTELSLGSTIEFLLKLPKPLSFNLFSLQYFPKYPLTTRAIADKYITADEASIDTLAVRTTKNWIFTPALFPWSKKQALQNIIWLIVNNHARDGIVRYSVSGKSPGALLCLTYLNFKAVIYGKILGVGGIISKQEWILYMVNGIKYLFKGDLKAVYGKIRKHLGLQPKKPREEH